MSETHSERRKIKELKVLELHDRGFSSRKIASLIHLSLRDVTKYIHRISNKTKSPSTTSVMDEVVLEYRISGMKHELRDLKIERDNLMNEVKDLRAQKYDVLNQVGARQSELDAIKRNLEYEKFSEILKDVFTEDQYHIL
jgi:predicted transcriptional regulator